MAIYIARATGKTQTVYGPFASETEARIANVLSQPIEATGGSRTQQRVHALRGIGNYTKSEIEYFSAPGADLVAYGYDNFVVQPADALKVDESWTKNGATLEWCREYAAGFGK